MALVRLQCPACNVIVKTTSEIATRHTVVRCGQCQGLVKTTDHRHLEALAPTREGSRKKPRRTARQAPVRLIVGGLVGLLVLAGLGVGVYFIVQHFSEGGPEKRLERNLALMQRLVETIEKVSTPGDVAPAMDIVIASTKELVELGEKNKQNLREMDHETIFKMMETYTPKMHQLRQRLSMAMDRITTNPMLAQALAEYARTHRDEMSSTSRSAMMLDYGFTIPTPRVTTQREPEETASARRPAPEPEERRPEVTNPPRESNPFETVTQGKGADADHGEKNPFEPAKPSTPKTPANNNAGMGNRAVEDILSKFTSTEFFKKQEALRELNTVKVDETCKSQVLDVLLTLFDDRDIHDKNDVFKLCKKWASTQADKELIGQRAEVLLQDTWVKKDALRYFGENKVISASKDVAKLLKDHFEQKLAAETLIAMGSEAEKPVLHYLTDLEPQVRHMAIEVLARIGTKESVPELQKVQNDRFVGNAARQAIRLILSRKKD